MIRMMLAATIALFPLAAYAQQDQQELVDRATLAVQDVANDTTGTQAQSLLRKARAAMICPRVFRAGFFFGGEGGACVLAARDGAGSWSYPAFYNMGGGSFGLQAGIQDAEVMMFIMTEKGLNAVIDDQFKIGANASIAFVTLGGGVEGSTTGAVGADIVAFAKTRGLYAGIALNGNLLTASSGWNQKYYGQPLATSQIVLQMQGAQPGRRSAARQPDARQQRPAGRADRGPDADQCPGRHRPGRQCRPAAIAAGAAAGPAGGALGPWPSRQSIGAIPRSVRNAFTRENGREPKKPAWADSGEGWAERSTRWSVLSIASA